MGNCASEDLSVHGLRTGVMVYTLMCMFRVSLRYLNLYIVCWVCYAEEQVDILEHRLS